MIIDIIYDNAKLPHKHLTAFTYEQADVVVDNDLYKYSVGKQAVKAERGNPTPQVDKLDELLTK